MAGNVWEWIGDGNPSQLRTPLRGGDWLFEPEEARTYHVRLHTPHRKNPFVGFRCTADSAELLK
jgi:formylglycine-generating enzyme required for sulfatase activity